MKIYEIQGNLGTFRTREISGQGLTFLSHLQSIFISLSIRPTILLSVLFSDTTDLCSSLRMRQVYK